MSRTDVMSEPHADPSLNAVPSPSAAEQSVPPIDGDVVNLLDGSIEPTDDSPTVISKATPSSGREDDNFSGGLRGRQLAHFELIEPIGIGGMAAVLRARDTQLDRLVALKILPPEMASDAENIRRFHQEARSAAKLDHENIARVFFCGEDQRLHFIAFEFVEGDNLRTILERRGRLPVNEALHYMLQVAAGLAHAARRGVVHRDIKPSNIIITPNGRAKLVDMGLARSLEPQHDMGLTQSGVTLGTFDYISPEQALEPRDADVRSDIYSLGCTFYHMLTGHPPVPEGTAAKKLHHHQHVKPTDPRQFVPDLPDEVAVILNRMMAKIPKDRYQSPEQLVHHLLMAARKLGSAVEVPEGGLAVEAALPNPPAGRPLVLAALAAVAVVALIFFIDQSPAPKTDSAILSQPDAKNEKKDKGLPTNQGVTRRPPLQRDDLPPTVEPRPWETSPPVFHSTKPTAADLAEFLQKNKQAPEIIIELADDLDLRDDRELDLIITNPVVTIRSRDPKKRPTIRYGYHARTSQALQTPLTIESKNCTVEGIRFVLDQNGASVPMAALLFRGTKQSRLRVDRCEFIQADPSGSEKNRMTSVLVESREPATLILSESCFLGFPSLGTTSNGGRSRMVFSGAASGGQDAITRRGPVRIEATNCVFGPHAATFRLEGSAPQEDGVVRLKHCSVQAANQSAVYNLAENADARIEASFSLFSQPGEARSAGVAEGKGAVLLRRVSTQGQVTYTGQHNCYHQLDSYLVVVNASEKAVQKLLEQFKNNDDSRELTSTPWKDPQPLKRLEKLEIDDAFRVNPRLAALRLSALKKAEGQLIGAEKVLSFSYVDKPLPRLDNNPVMPTGRRELIVEKRDRYTPGGLVYRTLAHAMLEARPGDTILLRHDGELKLDPIPLSAENLTDLTIRAARGFHPILTLSGTLEVDAALFRVYNGKLRLEDLELRLRPSRDAFEAQAVVSFLGEGECTLKDCLITLDRSGQKTALAVAVLMEPGMLMKKVDALPTPGPRFVLENCFVRGQGDLIWSRCGQPADLTVKNSLVALTGSLLNVEGNKDMPAPASSLIARLKQVTTFLGGHLIRMRAGKDLKSLASIQCEPDKCLFIPAVADRALIRLEGPESEERGLKEKLDWIAGMNAYGSFNTLLEQQAIGSPMKMPLPSNLADWKRDFGETDSQYGVKLTKLPDPENTLFTQLLPSAFQRRESLKGYGADVIDLRPLTTKDRAERKDRPGEEFDPDDL